MEGTIQHLFEGHQLSFIDCINVDYKSERKEAFLDLQLDVRGCKNVYESFDKYVEVEILAKENSYQAESFGLQVSPQRRSGFTNRRFESAPTRTTRRALQIFGTARLPRFEFHATSPCIRVNLSVVLETRIDREPDPSPFGLAACDSLFACGYRKRGKG